MPRHANSLPQCRAFPIQPLGNIPGCILAAQHTQLLWSRADSELLEAQAAEKEAHSYLSTMVSRLIPALRALPRSAVAARQVAVVGRRGYAEVADGKLALSLVLPHEVSDARRTFSNHEVCASGRPFLWLALRWTSPGETSLHEIGLPTRTRDGLWERTVLN